MHFSLFVGCAVSLAAYLCGLIRFDREGELQPVLLRFSPADIVLAVFAVSAVLALLGNPLLSSLVWGCLSFLLTVQALEAEHREDDRP